MHPPRQSRQAYPMHPPRQSRQAYPMHPPRQSRQAYPMHPPRQSRARRSGRARRARCTCRASRARRTRCTRRASRARRTRCTRRASRARRTRCTRRASRARRTRCTRRASRARRTRCTRRASRARRTRCTRRASRARRTRCTRRASRARRTRCTRRASRARRTRCTRRASRARRTGCTRRSGRTRRARSPRSARSASGAPLPRDGLVQFIDIALQLIHAALGIRHGSCVGGALISLRIGLGCRAALGLAGGQAHPVLRLGRRGHARVAGTGHRAGSGILALDHRGVGAGRRAQTGPVAGERFGVLVENTARLRRIDGAHGRRVGNRQFLPGPHQIHVALDERIGIGAPQRHQHLVDRGVRHRIALGNRKQRVARLHVDRPRRAAGAARRANGRGRNLGARAPQRHQDADLHLPLARAGADVQQQVDRAAGRRLRRPHPQVLAGRIHPILDPHHQAGQRRGRFQARALPRSLVGHRHPQRRDFVGCEFLQSHQRLQGRARGRDHPRMPDPHGQRRAASARADRQRDRPLEGLQTAGMLHLARTLGHKLEFRSCRRMVGRRLFAANA
ncbi:serine/arginine repetitive matrix 2 [Achromobacter xylosoxidans NBRC 15126 = ATCC 27061]|nr:serine/arginine repetitive matrix 2 [Achromobacter xylosoxidans NBRC 15126 = ATCC 27061]